MKSDTLLQDRQGKESFQFDRIFAPQVSTEQIFDLDMQKMMNNALKGYNVTVLAYGQTNSGKTFTIRGGIGNSNEYQPGMILLTAAQLFKTIEYLKTDEGIEQSLKEKNDQSVASLNLPEVVDQQTTSNTQMKDEEVRDRPSFSRPPSGVPNCLIKRDIKISVSYMEIYNENVNDLLDEKKRNLDVRENKGEVIVEHLTSKIVRSVDDMEQLLQLGEQVRMIASTKLNDKSTRSHTVFRINIEIDDQNEQTGRHTIRSS